MPLRSVLVALFMTIPGLTAQIAAMASQTPDSQIESKARLRPVAFSELAHWTQDDHRESWRVFADHCRAITAHTAPLRAGGSADAALLGSCSRALTRDPPRTRDQARGYFETLFNAHEILPLAGKNPYDTGFLTGYYEPVTDGSLTASAQFSEPVLSRPSDLVTLTPQTAPDGFPPGLAGARRRAGGSLEPYPARAAIENGTAADARPLLFVRDGIEHFMIQVQGSARINLPDGKQLRLTYAGRNGQPYTSIGKLMVERGHVASADLSLDRLKSWVRENGQKPGQAGRLLMQENKSFIFFKIDDTLPGHAGPVGAASIPLTPLRSIAVDRTLWAYGLPMWIDAHIPWRNMEAEPFRRLMIAQDTGSAILGAARADLFFGSGAQAGRLAGGIRHSGRMFVLLPKRDLPKSDGASR